MTKSLKGIIIIIEEWKQRKELLGMKKVLTVTILVAFFVIPISACAQSELRIKEDPGSVQNPGGSGKDNFPPKADKGFLISPQQRLLLQESLKIKSEPIRPSSPTPQSVLPAAPSTASPEKGAYNPRTGESYPGVFGGAINPQTGD